MSNVILFLETLGARPPLSEVDYAAAVARLEVDEETRNALKGADAAALDRLLHGRAALFCLVATPDDEDQQGSNPDDRDGDGEPDGDALPGQSS